MIDRFWILMDEHGNPIYTHKDRKRVEILGNLKATAYVPEVSAWTALLMACSLVQAPDGSRRLNERETQTLAQDLLANAKEYVAKLSTKEGLDEIHGEKDWGFQPQTSTRDQMPNRLEGEDPYEAAGVHDWRYWYKNPQGVPTLDVQPQNCHWYDPTKKTPEKGS